VNWKNTVVVNLISDPALQRDDAMASICSSAFGAACKADLLSTVMFLHFVESICVRALLQERAIS
jgi:hypothetical protein